jgi:hypothetical protein
MPGDANCEGITAAWSSGVADLKRNRLIIWGGGHGDYAGNEIYALDLNTQTMIRLDMPASYCTNCETNPDGSAAARHTYGGIDYIPTMDKMYVHGGGLWGDGSINSVGVATWLLDFPTLVSNGTSATGGGPPNSWTHMNPLNGTDNPNGVSQVQAAYESASAYDPIGDAVYYVDGNNRFWKYIPFNNTQTELNSFYTGASMKASAVVDPIRKKFYLIGSGVGFYSADLTQATPSIASIVTPTGCSTLAGAGYPGLEYDPVQDKIIALLGDGPNVTIFDPVAMSCTVQTYSSGPPALSAMAGGQSGVFGHFRYFPTLGVFAYYQDTTQNGWVLRMTPAVTAESNFAARCSAAGVVYCEGFDSASDFTPASGQGGYASGLYPGTSTSPVQDTVNKVSGAGSMKFPIPAYSAGASFPTSPAGLWKANTGPDTSHLTTFNPGTTFYMQFRMMVDAPMINYDWAHVSGEGWKVFIAFGPIPGTSCTGDQFVQENTDQRNILSGYTSCSTPALVTNGGNTPYDFQQGDMACPYPPGATDPTCLRYQPNVWITEYWKVTIGPYGTAATHFEAWASMFSQPYRKFIDLPNFSFGDNSQPSTCSAIPSTCYGLNEVIFEPYFSGAGTVPSGGTPAANMWIDEVILSTQPIATPTMVQTSSQ